MGSSWVARQVSYKVVGTPSVWQRGIRRGAAVLCLVSTVREASSAEKDTSKSTTTPRRSPQVHTLRFAVAQPRASWFIATTVSRFLIPVLSRALCGEYYKVGGQVYDQSNSNNKQIVSFSPVCFIPACPHAADLHNLSRHMRELSEHNLQQGDDIRDRPVQSRNLIAGERGDRGHIQAETPSPAVRRQSMQ